MEHWPTMQYRDRNCTRWYISTEVTIVKLSLYSNLDSLHIQSVFSPQIHANTISVLQYSHAYEYQSSHLKFHNFTLTNMPSVFMSLSAIFIGVFMESAGRKRVIQLAFVPLICRWALIQQSKSIFTLYVGRFMTGLTIGKKNAYLLFTIK